MSMEQMEKTAGSRERLLAVSRQLGELIAQGRAAEAQAANEAFEKHAETDGQRHLAEGMRRYLRKDFAGSQEAWNEANGALKDEEYPEAGSAFSAGYLNCQLALPRRERTATEKGYQYYRGNIEFLKEIDPALAEEVQRSAWPGELMLAEFWGGLHLFVVPKRMLLILVDAIRGKLQEKIEDKGPITLGGIQTGQEIRYCLHHKRKFLHSQSRPHYVFEPDAGKLKAFLHLDDFRAYLQSRELIVFGGNGIQTQVFHLFDTLRYQVPEFTVGNVALVQSNLKPVIDHIILNSSKEAVEEYYASKEFRERLQQIARGEILPRIMINTSRWTTFLKYCAADFEKAFGLVGCKTKFLIETNDAQSLTPFFYWRELNAFRPDAYFMVSHARPTMPILPRELPVIGYIQDICGPIQQKVNISDSITRDDLFVCMQRKFERYLHGKGVPSEQTMVLPIPADEEMFYPLEADDYDFKGSHARFCADIGFVKHGSPTHEKVFASFLNEQFLQVDSPSFRQMLADVYTRLYQEMCEKMDRCRYEPEMQAFIRSCFSSNISETLVHALENVTRTFYTVVYSAAWRYQFLEALDQSGFDLGLYGNRWEENERLCHRARGPVQRGLELNYVYNFNRINLNINHELTLHQRLSECALAGGFLMVAAHPREYDETPACDYYEPDREMAEFRTQEELVEKCRYYLSHEEKRREIADTMRQKALRNHTCRVAADTIISQWRKRITDSRI